MPPRIGWSESPDGNFRKPAIFGRGPAGRARGSGFPGLPPVTVNPLKMNALVNLFTSSIGKKFLMAITGVVLFFFVIGHMLGNLQIFLGPEVLNRYGAFLKSNPGVLWGVRIVLLVIVAIHITTAVQLSLANTAARPEKYLTPANYKSSYASRTMIWSGVILLAFIIYHLLHFTALAIDPGFAHLHDAQGRHDVYRMVVLGFSHPLVSLFYIFSMALLCLHLSHGVSAMFQSLGLKNKAYGTLIDRFALAAAVIIFLGYSSIPVAVLLGIVK